MEEKTIELIANLRLLEGQYPAGFSKFETKLCPEMFYRTSTVGVTIVTYLLKVICGETIQPTNPPYSIQEIRECIRSYNEVTKGVKAPVPKLSVLRDPCGLLYATFVEALSQTAIAAAIERLNVGKVKFDSASGKYSFVESKKTPSNKSIAELNEELNRINRTIEDGQKKITDLQSLVKDKSAEYFPDVEFSTEALSAEIAKRKSELEVTLEEKLNEYKSLTARAKKEIDDMGKTLGGDDGSLSTHQYFDLLGEFIKKTNFTFGHSERSTADLLPLFLKEVEKAVEIQAESRGKVESLIKERDGLKEKYCERVRKATAATPLKYEYGAAKRYAERKKLLEQLKVPNDSVDHEFSLDMSEIEGHEPLNYSSQSCLSFSEDDEDIKTNDGRRSSIDEIIKKYQEFKERNLKS